MVDAGTFLPRFPPGDSAVRWVGNGTGGAITGGLALSSVGFAAVSDVSALKATMLLLLRLLLLLRSRLPALLPCVGTEGMWHTCRCSCCS